ncbi:MAG TPA: ABC transporter ATP-binding protein [Dehalococcoidia bacterium]|nr:ABC transporter ATP-binding protein [Dehalococcoidia bacterium]
MTSQVEEPAAGEEGGASEIVIRASGLHKIYDTGTIRVNALMGVDLAVPRGEMVAIMGPSGCGKTTLLNCLSGLDTFDEGSVLIENTDISRMADDAKTEFRARDMGFIFQTYNLLPVLSAVENVELPLIVSGTKPRLARALAIKALERVQLSEYAAQRPAQLSGGQRQRVTVARAVVNSPAIVWADEPTGALDSKTANEIMDLLVEVNLSAQQTQVIVTHAPEVAARCDRTIYMADGLIVREESGKGDRTSTD